MYDLVVVGSGLFGLTVAEHAARLWDARVALVEKRDHIGGNAYSETDPETGIEVHKYGAHLFHTSNEKVWEYARRFTDFNDYIHHVQTTVDGVVYPMPVNLGTINQFFQASYSPDAARALIRRQAAEVPEADANLNFEAKGISLVGRPLFDAFFRDYTAKQWQVDPSELPASVVTRLPVRYNYNSRYFSDRYEGLPLDGYTAWFERMIASPNIDLFLGADYLAEPGPAVTWPTRSKTKGIPVVYTGPLDRYFDYSKGKLGWRTVDFQVERPATGDFQGCSVMNYGDMNVSETRTIEFRHFHPERDYPKDKTVVFREFSRGSSPRDEPYYPVNAPVDRETLRAYRGLIKHEENVYFGGRLGLYRYLDMDATVASAIAMVRQKLAPLFRPA